MKLALGILIWAVAFVLRLVFIIIGWFFVPLTLLGDGARNTPPMWRPVFGNIADAPAAYRVSRWKSYVWMAWRNPTEGLDTIMTQPIGEKHPNPDKIVRTRAAKAAKRWMQHGVFWEFWYLRAMGDRFFEFRIGWKFVDGNRDFVPTIQLGPKR